MTKERLAELLRVTGNIIPEGMEEHISDLETRETELLPRETLPAVLNGNGVPEEKQKPLLDALAFWTANERATAAGYIRLLLMLVLPLYLLLKGRERKKLPNCPIWKRKTRMYISEIPY